MKKFISFCLILSFILTFSSCKKEQEILSIYYPVKTKLNSLDPQIASGDTSKISIANIFDGLVYVDEDGSIKCAAAESYNISDDGLKYTFNLRKNSFWKLTNTAKSALNEKLPKSFDNRVTAYDFVFALRRAVAPNTAAQDAVLLSSIKNAEEILEGTLVPEHLGVRAVSDYVLEINLKEKQADFLNILALPLCMPCNEVFFEACGGRYGLSLSYTLSNGPFYFARWRDDLSLRIAKDEDYTGPRQPFIDSIYLYENHDSEDILNKLNSGSYNIAYLDSNEYSMLKKPQTFKTLEFENELWAFCFNLADENLANKNLRKAIAYSISQGIFKNLADTKPNERTIPPFCLPNYEAPIIESSPLNYNTEKAQQELKKALISLEKSTIDIVLSCAFEHETLLRQQMQEWQKVLGVDVNIRISALDFEDLQTAVRNKNYDIAFYPLLAEGIEAENFYKMFLSNAKNNIVNVNDSKLDDAIKELIKSNSLKNQKSILSDIEKFLIDEMIYYPVFTKSNYLVMKDNIKGVYIYPSPDTIYFHNSQFYR